jgi:predicted amidohydrolase YtcJ
MNRLVRPLGLLALIAWSWAYTFAPQETEERVDLLFHGGAVAVMDDLFSIHSAVAIRAGRVVAVGGEELTDRYRADRTVNLAGRLVVPGFNDTHMHVWGESARTVDLAGSRSIVEIQDRIRAMAEVLGPDEWIPGLRWSEDELAERRRPSRQDLDAAAPRNPVIITRAGSHSSVANSLALKLAGIDRDTRDPEGGFIERDENGEPTGVLRQRAQGLVQRLVPPGTEEELRRSFLDNLRSLPEVGVTSMIVAGARAEDYRDLWRSTYAAHGDELPRAAVQIRTSDAAVLRGLGLRTGDGDDRLRLGALKVSVDGGYTGAAAWTLEPYADQAGFHGALLVPEDELYALVREAHDLGWQVGLHTIGDAAIQLTVDVIERVLRESPRHDHRHYLNHFTVPPPAETMRKMAVNNILIAQQPNFVYTLEGRYVQHLDGFRLEYNNPVRLPQRYGIFVALGNDVLPTDPRVALYAAVTRKGMSGRVFGPDDRLTVPEALRGYTRSGAYLTWEEDIKGTLEPGMLADLVVLGDNILESSPDRILDVPIDMTVIGGRIIYERGQQ